MTQKEALEILKSGKNVFLTGEPGAGKSYTINLFKDELAKKYIYPDVTASTGIAATHINGITIHSWAGMGIKEVIKDADVRAILQKPYVVRRIQSCKTLIIDEVSMINAQTLDNVDLIMRKVRGEVAKQYESLSFGGVQMIFVGDFFQLPPVSKNKDVKFAFESGAWLAAEPSICYLTEQHRQDDPQFLELLTAMRSGTFLEKVHLDLLKKRRVKAPNDITRLFTHNADVDRVNETELEKLPGAVHTYHMSSDGFPFLVELLKKHCLSPETLTLKVGAPVMFTRNDIQKDGSVGRFVNGTLGTVTGFSNGNDYPIIETKQGRTVALDERVEWSIEEHGHTKASIKQIPLRLAWAITVHKCQGMSLDSATMDLSRAFEYGQGYVALSRVKSLEGLYLEGLNKKALLMHPTVVKKDGIFRKLSNI